MTRLQYITHPRDECIYSMLFLFQHAILYASLIPVSTPNPHHNLLEINSFSLADSHATVSAAQNVLNATYAPCTAPFISPCADHVHIDTIFNEHQHVPVTCSLSRCSWCADSTFSNHKSGLCSVFATK